MRKIIFCPSHWKLWKLEILISTFSLCCEDISGYSRNMSQMLMQNLFLPWDLVDCHLKFLTQPRKWLAAWRLKSFRKCLKSLLHLKGMGRHSQTLMAKVYPQNWLEWLQTRSVVCLLKSSRRCTKFHRPLMLAAWKLLLISVPRDQKAPPNHQLLQLTPWQEQELSENSHQTQLWVSHYLICRRPWEILWIIRPCGRFVSNPRVY